MGARLMAIVAEGERGRVYLAADAGAWRGRARRSRMEAGVDDPEKPRGYARGAAMA